MKDTFIPSKSSLQKEWYIIDATNKCLGRLATEIVYILRGKNKIFYNPAQDLEQIIIVINSSKVSVTGKKSFQKVYFRHSGRPGGDTLETFKNLQKRLPERILEKAVKGMLPKNKLGRRLFKNLKVYKGKDHPHISQQPKFINI
uniref:Large ribosomal subunit protein uL13c n=1 Tax=Schizocladia ischiensis TaxID=196139 RepID=A0A7S6UA18_9STRA|nr:ribosomal protein L13 [Schizocladia ischiensis]QOW07556.1 ribosomal protein L13 [Schizocladia ischiensis]